jgi:hypothetical protein
MLSRYSPLQKVIAVTERLVHLFYDRGARRLGCRLPAACMNGSTSVQKLDSRWRSAGAVHPFRVMNLKIQSMLAGSYNH